MKNLLMLVALCTSLAACNQVKQEAAPAMPAAPMPLEFADTTYVNICKKGMTDLVNGDVDGFTSSLADNAVYAWNFGDSVAGKNAIVEYWKDRRNNVIEKLGITNEIWLGLKVNQSEQVAPGNYVFLWAKINVSYKGGKSMTQWVHNIYHFNASEKMDRVTQFIDRVPIMAAMPQKK
jgi:uncharacterized protein YuzB (UPF0349 family)